MGKIGKQKTSAAAYVSDDLVGHFLVLLERKERVAVAVAVAAAVAVVGLNIGVDHSCSVALFVPSTLLTFWTKDESFFHPPSYILHPPTR